MSKTLLATCKKALESAETLDDIEYIEEQIDKRLNRRLKADRELERELQALIRETINIKGIPPFE